MNKSNFVAGEQTISHAAILPPEVVGDGTVKLFNKWSFEDVEVKDISLTYEYLLLSESDV
jgi:hypothetical protein